MSWKGKIQTNFSNGSRVQLCFSCLFCVLRMEKRIQKTQTHFSNRSRVHLLFSRLFLRFADGKTDSQDAKPTFIIGVKSTCVYLVLFWRFADRKTDPKDAINGPLLVPDKVYDAIVCNTGGLLCRCCPQGVTPWLNPMSQQHPFYSKRPNVA